MKTITTEANQTVWDIALQELGSAEGVFDILLANAFLRFDYSLPAGVNILIPEGLVRKPDVVDYYVKNNIHPATGDGQLAVIDQENMIRIEQTLAYDLAGGNKSFDGKRLFNLKEILSIQVNYTDVSLAGVAYVEQSLDGINYDPIEDASQAIPAASGSITFNLNGLVTDYCRVRWEQAGATTGTIDSIIWRV